MRKASESILEDATRSFRSADAPLTDPQVAAPSDLGELLTIAGFQATARSGASIQDGEWGSGHQAFFLYQLLYALDTHYSRFFGWKQATIWGVEEPESGLHRDLETKMAGKIRQWADDKRSKMQVLMTTHSPILTMAAASGYWTSIDAGGFTALQPDAIPMLVRNAELRGVSGWTQPILSFPSCPVVLVEGPTDADVLAHAAFLDGTTDVRFLPLPVLDPAARGGGKDAITTYLKLHGGLIKNRPPESPLIVLLDWDLSDEELRRAREAYGAGSGSRVLRMNDSYCDVRMAKSFAGVERFYPPATIEECVARGDFDAAVNPARKISIAKDELNKAKQPLVRAIKDIQDPTRIPALIRVWGDVKAAIQAPP